MEPDGGAAARRWLGVGLALSWVSKALVLAGLLDHRWVLMHYTDLGLWRGCGQLAGGGCAGIDGGCQLAALQLPNCQGFNLVRILAVLATIGVLLGLLLSAFIKRRTTFVAGLLFNGVGAALGLVSCALFSRYFDTELFAGVYRKRALSVSFALFCSGCLLECTALGVLGAKGVRAVLIDGNSAYVTDYFHYQPMPNAARKGVRLLHIESKR